MTKKQINNDNNFPEKDNQPDNSNNLVPDENSTNPITPEPTPEVTEPVTDELTEPVTDELTPKSTNTNSDKSEPNEPVTPAPKAPPKQKDSNYQVSLVNENLLKIRVTTDKTIGIDCFVKDKKSTTGAGAESQTNKITIHPTEEKKLREVEIIVSIDSETGNVIVTAPDETGNENTEPQQPDTKETYSNEKRVVSPEPQEPTLKGFVKKLLINPDVEDLVNKQKQIDSENKYVPRTYEEIQEEKLGPKNGYKQNRQFFEKNFKTGIIGGIAIYFLTIIFGYSTFAKKNGEEGQVPNERLIVIQDIPDNTMPLPEQDKPEEETTTGDSGSDPVTPPKVNIKKPRVPKVPKIKTNPPSDTNVSSINKELDSLRKLSSNSGSDTSKYSTAAGNDTLNFAGKNIPISIPFPKYNWSLIDSVEAKLTGLTNDTTILIVDRSNNRGPGDFNLFVYLDKSGKTFNVSKYESFTMLDTTLLAYKSEPFKSAGKIDYKFLVKNAIYQVSVLAQVREKYFEEYKPKIEDVVRNIRLPNSLPPPK